jgi:hypothetical protein
MKKPKIEPSRGNVLQSTIELVNNLVRTNEEMAVMALTNAKKITVMDPYRQGIINRAIAMGECEIAKAYDQLAEGRPCQAVRRLKVAWRHAQYALFIGLEKPVTSKTNDNGGKDMGLELKCFLSRPWLHFRRLIGLERKGDQKEG